MKKKTFQQKLNLGKKKIVAFQRNRIMGGDTADCPPPTFQDCGTNNCNTNDCDSNNCGTNNTCLTDAAASCTPRGCGNSQFNC